MFIIPSIEEYNYSIKWENEIPALLKKDDFGIPLVKLRVNWYRRSPAIKKAIKGAFGTATELRQEFSIIRVGFVLAVKFLRRFHCRLTRVVFNSFAFAKSFIFG